MRCGSAMKVRTSRNEEDTNPRLLYFPLEIISIREIEWRVIQEG